MRVKAGVNLDGISFMILYAAALANYYRQGLGYGEATITGGREPADEYGPARVSGTLHPGGNALDVRTVDLPGGPTGAAAQQWAGYLAQALGGAFRVLVEADHIHIEYRAPLRA